MPVTISVWIDPAGSGNYVICADPEDPPTPWLGQTASGHYQGWVPASEVADWPECHLHVPDTGAAP